MTGGAAVDDDTERLSRPVRIAVMIVVVVLATWIVAPNLPDGPLERRIDAAWEPARQIGLVQD